MICMNKKYQIFISSTYEDLKEERQAAIKSVLKIGHIPTGMELFHASNDDQWGVITKIIDECDYYLLIIGGRYGSLDDSGISYTEKEYDYAKEIGKPIIAFVHNDDNYLDGTEKNPDKLRKFKEKVMNNKLVDKWENKDALSSGIVLGLLDVCKDCPASGWIRGDQIPSDSLMMEVIRLQNENAELKSELANSSGRIEKTTEHLQQGDQLFKINYTYNRSGSSFSWYNSVTISWDDIFGIIARNLLWKKTEDQIRYHLGLGLALKSIYGDREEIGKTVVINTEDFSKIKFQLFALKLIEITEDTQTIKPTVYWNLTEYGKEYAVQNIALR